MKNIDSFLFGVVGFLVTLTVYYFLHPFKPILNLVLFSFFIGFIGFPVFIFFVIIPYEVEQMLFSRKEIRISSFFTDLINGRMVPSTSGRYAPGTDVFVSRNSPHTEELNLKGWRGKVCHTSIDSMVRVDLYPKLVQKWKLDFLEKLIICNHPIHKMEVPEECLEAWNDAPDYSLKDAKWLMEIYHKLFAKMCEFPFKTKVEANSLAIKAGTEVLVTGISNSDEYDVYFKIKHGEKDLEIPGCEVNLEILEGKTKLLFDHFQNNT